MTHITDATVWIVSTRGMADASAANEFGYTTGAHEALMVKVEDYEAARAEVTRLRGTPVPLTEWQQMEAERDKLREEVARLDHVNKLAYQHYEELTAALEEANVDREAVLLKDRIKTREINVLVEENRAMRANDARLRRIESAALAICGPSTTVECDEKLTKAYVPMARFNKLAESLRPVAATALTQEKRGG